MLFETYGQFNVFLAFIWLGLGLALIYDLFHYSSKIKKAIFDFVICILGGLLFIYFMHYYNLGQFRLFLCIGLVIGILFERIFFAKMLESFSKLLYNYYIKILTNVKNKYILNIQTSCTTKSKIKTKNKNKIKHKKNAQHNPTKTKMIL